MAEFPRQQQNIKREPDWKESNVPRQPREMSLHDTTQEAIRNPSASGARGFTSPVDGGLLAMQVARKRSTDGSKNAQTAAGRQQIGIPIQRSRVSTNSDQQVLSAVPQVHMHVAETQKQVPPPNKPSTGVGEMMITLGKFESLALGDSIESTNPNDNFSTQVKEKACSSVGPGSNPTKVIPSTSRCELEKWEKKEETIVKQEHMRVAGTQQPVPPPTKTSVGVRGIMINLGKLKSLAMGESFPSTNPNDNFSTQVNQKACRSVRPRSIPTKVIPSTSRCELEKWEKKEETIVKQEQRDEVGPEQGRKDRIILRIKKKSAPRAAEGNVKEEGKAPIPKKYSERNYRFLPIQSSSIRGNGIDVSPSQTSSWEVVPSTSSAMLTITKPAATAAATVSAVVAKKSTVFGKKSAADVAAGVTGRRIAVVGKKYTASPKKPLPLPNTTMKGKEVTKVTRATQKKIVPNMPGTVDTMPDLSGVGSFTGTQGKQHWNCLVCNKAEPEESSKDMICCDECANWYHFDCVGIMADVAEDDHWYCKICINKKRGNEKEREDFPELFKND